MNQNWEIKQELENYKAENARLRQINSELTQSLDLFFRGKNTETKVPLLNLNLAASIDTDLDSLSDCTMYETKWTVEKPLC